MKLLVFKYLLTAALIVLVSEVAKRSDKGGALIGALPLMTCMVLIWLYLDQQPMAKIATYSRYTFWYVLPTLPMFLIFPLLLERLGFWLALLASALVAMLCFALLAFATKPFGIDLW